MTNFKVYTSRVMFIAVAAVMMFVSSCKKDETTPDFSAPTITVTPGSAQVMPGSSQTFSIAVAAEGGLASVDLGGTEIKSYTTDTKSDAFTYEYSVDAGTAEGDVTLTFTVTDKQATAKTGTQTVTVTVTATPKETVVVDASISENTTWSADKFYLLKGNVYVEAGAELTIEAGTIIIGDKTTKGALIVDRGAKIHAVGTESDPIVFSSSAPAGFRNYGDWGGVVLLGKAQNNQSVDQKIEGVSATSGDDGLHGTGTTLADASQNGDNSGEFQYVRIEFAGIALSTDNELNGLTFGSVGSGTQVDHVQVSFSGDDSYEWFGGTVNVHHLIAYRGWDDEFDTDFGFSGSGQFLASFRDPNIADKSGSNGFESDNDGSGSDNVPLTSAVFSNVSFYGPFVYAALKSGALSGGNVNNNYQHGGHIRRNTALRVFNTAFIGTGKIDGVFFENTNAAAIFKGNYFARLVGPVESATPKSTNPYDDSNFANDNPAIEPDLTAVDISSTFTGMDVALDIAVPFAPLASNSPLADKNTNGRIDVHAIKSNLTTVDYIGAFGPTETSVDASWMKGWANFDPNNTDYGF